MNRLLLAFFLVLLLSVNIITITAKDASDLSISHNHVVSDWTVVDERIEKDEVKSVPHMFFGHDFAQRDRAQAEDMMTYTVMIEPKNIEELVLSTSNPSSPNYQKVYSAQEIDELSANPAGTAAVTEYFQGLGMEVKQTSGNGGYLSVTGSTHSWERAMNTEFHVYNSERNPESKLVRAKQYSFPSSIAHHVRQVVNAIDFPTPIGGFAATKKQEALRAKAAARTTAAISASNEKLLTDPEPSLPPFVTLSPDTVIGPIKK